MNNKIVKQHGSAPGPAQALRLGGPQEAPYCSGGPPGYERHELPARGRLIKQSETLDLIIMYAVSFVVLKIAHLLGRPHPREKSARFFFSQKYCFRT